MKIVMDEEVYNQHIENIAGMIVEDNVSIDEQDPSKLEKYKVKAMSDFNLRDEDAMKLVYEALLYLKLKNSSDSDPLTKGDQFGAGFS